MGQSRRDVLTAFGVGALSGILPAPTRAAARLDLYDIGAFGNARILHVTDTHAQINPVFFREPNVNIGVGASVGRPPHLVGEAYLKHYGIRPGARRAYAFTYLDFDEAGHRYGRMGGFAHLKTLIDKFRSEAPKGDCLLLDGGDLWQGSSLAHFTHGEAMVELSNLFGVDAMTGHWEFTYGEKQVRKNIAQFKGSFIAQNVFLSDEAAFNDAPAFDKASGRVFEPYIVRRVGDAKIVAIGQAFPYQPIAHPQRFTHDWTFGIREQKLQKLVDSARSKHKPDAIVLLSHNGMDVDLKLASRVTGIDVILGGHTHDTTPRPSVVSNSGGKTLVVNGGTNGKFIGVLDLQTRGGKVSDFRYTLVPVFSNLIAPDPAVASLIGKLQAPWRNKTSPLVAKAEQVLYRRGNFNGTIDQAICDALRSELDAEIALSPGFRWGPSFLPGHDLLMDDILSETAITYPSVYVQQFTGTELKSVLEDVCDNLFNKDPYLQQGGDMVRVGGMRYVCAPDEVMGKRISDMTLDNGRAIEASKSYKIAGWASVSLPQTGRPIWDVVADHFRQIKNVRVPVLNQPKLRGVANNPGVGI